MSSTSKKNIVDLIDDKLEDDSHLSILLCEMIYFSRKNYDGDSRKTSSLVGIMYYTHLYFTASRWRTTDETYNFFKESLMRHSIESPPNYTEVFEPNEAKEALLFFIEIYLRNLPLTRLICLPHYQLRLNIETRMDGLTEYKE